MEQAGFIFGAKCTNILYFSILGVLSVQLLHI